MDYDVYRWCHGRHIEVDTLNVLFEEAFRESPPHVLSTVTWYISLNVIRFTQNELTFIGELLVVLLHHALGKIISLQYQITHCDDEFSDLRVVLSPFVIFNAVWCVCILLSAVFSSLSGFLGLFVPLNVCAAMLCNALRMRFNSWCLWARLLLFPLLWCCCYLYRTSALINTVTAHFPESNYYIVMMTSFIPRWVVYKLASLKDRNSEPYLKLFLLYKCRNKWCKNHCVSSDNV